MPRQNDQQMTKAVKRPKMRRLTTTLIDAAIRAGARNEPLRLRDSELRGFSARIGRSGALSYVIQCVDLSGTQRAYTLTPADFSDDQEPADPDDARDVARTIKRRLAKDAGYDPIRDKGDRRRARGAHTVNDLCDAWLPERAFRGKAAAGARSKFRIIRPALGKLPLVALRRDDIVKLHRDIAATRPILANRVAALLSAMWSFAGDGVHRVGGLKWIDPGLPNPCVGVQNRAFEKPRERVMTPAEFARISAALEREGDTPPARALQLLAMTMARRGEVLSMEWAHLDLARGIWLRPASAMKAGKRHAVQLSAPAVDLLRRMERERQPGEAFLFPGSGHSLTGLTRAWDRIRKATGITDVTIHDIRRTMASWAVSSGVDLYTVSRMLAHSNVSITQKAYAHLADEPQREGFARVAQLIASATAPDGSPAGK